VETTAVLSCAPFPAERGRHSCPRPIVSSSVPQTGAISFHSSRLCDFAPLPGDRANTAGNTLTCPQPCAWCAGPVLWAHALMPNEPHCVEEFKTDGRGRHEHTCAPKAPIRR
ncbi:hypothetical protein TraAM80_08829, partial [Trypanosoma rangeli]